MIEVRSIKGSVLLAAADAKHGVFRKRTDRVIALADALEISKRSCWAYIYEERRIPNRVAARFVMHYGEVPENGWREIQMERPYVRRFSKKAISSKSDIEVLAKEVAQQLISAGLADIISGRMANIRGHLQQRPAEDYEIGNLLKLLKEEAK